jgi:hypothetical protein
MIGSESLWIIGFGLGFGITIMAFMIVGFILSHIDNGF